MTTKHLVYPLLAWGLIGTAGYSQTVEVRPGDTLALIAERELGRARGWIEICAANSNILDDCDRIEPGMLLEIPGMAGSVEAAPVVTQAVEAPEEDTETPVEATEANESVAGEFETPGSLALDFVAPEGTSAETGENGGVLLSGTPAGRGAGGRPGIHLTLTKELETKASGNTVSVTVVAASETATVYLASYSTHEVGNSGWRELSAGPNGIKSTFSFNVPKLQNGSGDFLGFLPDPDGTGQTVEILSVVVDVVPQS